MRRGVIVRDMNVYGLPEWIRVSVGTGNKTKSSLAELIAVAQPSTPSMTLL
jgi:histidinol-phosphate/aromatic aminotransferase/cobyric acid decarboxylase-like protein